MEWGIRNDRVVVLRGDASETDGLPHEYGDALGLHLLHDLSAIAFDCPHTDIQLGGNGVTGEPLHDVIEDFDLSRCQSRELHTESLLRLPEILLLERPRKCPFAKTRTPPESEVAGRLSGTLIWWVYGEPPQGGRAWLRIFVVRCGLPCDPPVGVIHAMGNDTTLPSASL